MNPEPTDLDIRMGTMAQEFSAQIALIAQRSATYAAELASTQAKLARCEKRIAELTPPPDAPDLKAVA